MRVGRAYLCGTGHLNYDTEVHVVKLWNSLFAGRQCLSCLVDRNAARAGFRIARLAGRFRRAFNGEDIPPLRSVSDDGHHLFRLQ